MIMGFKWSNLESAGNSTCIFFLAFEAATHAGTLQRITKVHFEISQSTPKTMFEMSQRDEISRDISESSSKFLAKNRSVMKFRTTFRTKFRRDAEISKADKTMAQRNFAHVRAKIRRQTKFRTFSPLFADFRRNLANFVLITFNQYCIYIYIYIYIYISDIVTSSPFKTKERIADMFLNSNQGHASPNEQELILNCPITPARRSSRSVRAMLVASGSPGSGMYH